MFIVTDNADELLAEAAAFDAELHAGLTSLTEETCVEAAAHARAVGQFQDHSGNLRRGIVGFLVQKTETGAQGQIASVMPYSSFVEGGTRPHEIRARGAALRWEGPNGLRFAKVVHHPGSRPYPFMGPAYLKAQALLPAKGEALLAKLVSAYSE